jgi:mannan endo-1,4-beta-mannosidase
LYANPGPWAQLEGVDFVRNHRAPGIDFATVHVYVDQWWEKEKQRAFRVLGVGFRV